MTTRERLTSVSSIFACASASSSHHIVIAGYDLDAQTATVCDYLKRVATELAKAGDLLSRIADTELKALSRWSASAKSCNSSTQ
jgi:hypothetical protein